MFKPLAPETLGLINSSGISFLVELGQRLTDVSWDAPKPCVFFNDFTFSIRSFVFDVGAHTRRTDGQEACCTYEDGRTTTGTHTDKCKAEVQLPVVCSLYRTLPVQCTDITVAVVRTIHPTLNCCMWSMCLRRRLRLYCLGVLYCMLADVVYPLLC